MKHFIFGFVAITMLGANPAWSSSQEESAEQLAALFRSFRKAIVMNPPSIHEPQSFFSNPDNRMMISAQAKSFYRATVGSAYSSSDGLHQSMEQALDTVMSHAAEGGNALDWSGENDYVKKWNGKLLPARFAAMLATEFNALTKGSAMIKLTTSPDLLVNEQNAPACLGEECHRDEDAEFEHGDPADVHRDGRRRLPIDAGRILRTGVSRMSWLGPRSGRPQDPSRRYYTRGGGFRWCDQCFDQEFTGECELTTMVGGRSNAT